MKLTKYLVSFLIIVGCCKVTTAPAQQSNTLVTITGLQESNVVTRVERLDSDSNRTNVTTKTKFYQQGHLVEDRVERKGRIDLTGMRIYHDGQLVMYETWDSKSNVRQRTFLRDGRAVVTEVSSKSSTTPDLILFQGKDEQVVAALKRADNGEVKMLDSAALSEIQVGSKDGTEFMNDLSGETRSKVRSK